MVLPLCDTGVQPDRRRRRRCTCSARNNSLIALDATTGKEIWIHEGLGGIVARGINYWQSADGKDKRLLFSINSYLQAIDAATGKSILTFGENGIVDLRNGLAARADGRHAIQSNSPGKVWKNLSSSGRRPAKRSSSPPGDIRAYDVVTGQKVWQFHTIPQPGEFGYDTWPKEAYKYVGGANNWGSMSVDEERGIVYVPTGSATYDFYGADRHRRRTSSPTACSRSTRGPASGSGTSRPCTTTSGTTTTSRRRSSSRSATTAGSVDAVAHAGKTGFLYVFDRVTGEPLWPIEERPVPKSDVPGEQAWPTQPFPTKPAPFARQTFTVDDVNPWLPTPEQYEAMKERVAKARATKGSFTPPALDRHDLDARQPGRLELGHDGRESGEGAGVRRRTSIRSRSSARRRQDAERCPRVAAAVAAAVCVAPGRLPDYQQTLHSRAMGRTCSGALPGVADARRQSPTAWAKTRSRRRHRRPRPYAAGVRASPTSEMAAVIAYLALRVQSSRRPRRRRGRGARRQFPPGPVVASGGAPQPPPPPRFLGPFYPGVGGNAGNLPYPAEVKAALPATRYMSDYGVLASFTKPPYTDADRLRPQHRRDQAGRCPMATTRRRWPRAGRRIPAASALQMGIVVTKGGLGVPRRRRRQSSRPMTRTPGKVLWTGTFRGSTSGVPVSYEAKGRRYFVMISSAGGGRGGGRGAAGPPDENRPVGAIAFALPRKDGNSNNVNARFAISLRKLSAADIRRPRTLRRSRNPAASWTA